MVFTNAKDVDTKDSEMKHLISRKLRFSEIRKDYWLALEGKLSARETLWLMIRRFLYRVYCTTRFVLLFPVILVRYMEMIVSVLTDFERLHFLPLRKISRGVGCVIDRQTWLMNGHNISLGDFVKISAFSSIMAGKVSTIKIGTNTIIGPGVVVVSLNHGTDVNGVPIRYQEWKDTAEDSIVIGDDVWIGANVVILPGTSIGNGSVIGAGTIIKGVVPPNTINYRETGKLNTILRK